MVVTARTIRFKEIISIIRKRFVVFLYLNKYLYNGMRRDYNVLRRFNDSLCFDVIFRVDVDIGAKVKVVIEDQGSVNIIIYYYYYSSD